MTLTDEAASRIRIGINTAAEHIYQSAVERGFYAEPVDPVKILAHIVEEVGECLRVLRDGHPPDAAWRGTNGKPEGLKFELWDIVSLCLGGARALGLDIADAAIEKERHNSTRGRLHGRAW